jgi:Tfp pilus assembly protein PilN
MRAVNLLPLDARAGRRRPPTAALAVAGLAVLAAGVLVMGFVSASSKVDERERELAMVEKDLSASRRAAQPAKPVPAGRDTEREQRFSALNDALDKRLAWDRVLREVSLVLPEDVWFSSLAAAASSAGSGSSAPTTPTTGQTITFNGFTYSQEGVARFLARLALVPDLANVKLEKSSVTEVGSQHIYGFTAVADVNPGGTP